MRQSHIFSKTSKTVLEGEVSTNAKLLEQGGFVYKNSAGVYSYLPIGWRVFEKISQIVKEEMNKIGGLEMYMPALHDKHYLEATGRWNTDVVFKIQENNGKEPNFNISWIHEEIIAEIAGRFVSSYKDLPFSVYQIQTKFRNEPRAKSGLLRGREFTMKDLYSFHTSEDDLWRFYAEVKEAYLKIFNRCGVTAYYTLAPGGEFTVSNTHEFQVVSPIGEDTILLCDTCKTAENVEISKLKAGDKCPNCAGVILEKKSIEVGNIFPLGTKYSEAFNLKYTDQTGKSNFVVMGSYGIGIGRLMGTIVEVSNDERGILWPESVAPFRVHLIHVPGKDVTVKERAEELYHELQARDIEVLYDDRDDKRAGERFADSDLYGVPIRLVISEKTLATDSVEYKLRKETTSQMVSVAEIANVLTQK